MGVTIFRQMLCVALLDNFTVISICAVCLGVVSRFYLSAAVCTWVCMISLTLLLGTLDGVQLTLLWNVTGGK